MSEFSEGMAVGQSIGQNNHPGYSGYGMNGFGDGWWILLLLLCGWGNNGWGNNAGGNFTSYELGRVATTNDVANGFSTSALMSNQREMQLALTNGFADVNATVNAVGNNINQGICNLGYNLQNNFNQLSHQVSDCCCQTQRAIDGVNFNMAKGFCDVIQAGHNDTQRIIDFMSAQEVQALRDKLQAANFQISQMNQNALFAANQEAQTATLIRRLGRDCPTPAFLVPNPNCCYPNNYGSCNG
jgi:hypothetical protein